jgi:hypothetical protein
MSASFQSILALGIVVIAVVLLLYSLFRKKKNSGCGGEGCGAISPEVKKLQARLKR